MDLINMILLCLNLLFFISTRLYFKQVHDLTEKTYNNYKSIIDTYKDMRECHDLIYKQYQTLSKQYNNNETRS